MTFLPLTRRERVDWLHPPLGDRENERDRHDRILRLVDRAPLHPRSTRTPNGIDAKPMPGSEIFGAAVVRFLVVTLVQAGVDLCSHGDYHPLALSAW